MHYKQQYYNDFTDDPSGFFAWSKWTDKTRFERRSRAVLKGKRHRIVGAGLSTEWTRTYLHVIRLFTCCGLRRQAERDNDENEDGDGGD